MPSVMELMLYFYMLVCFFIFIFNIGYICYNKTEQWRRRRGVEHWKKLLNNACRRPHSEQHAKLLIQKLQRLNALDYYNEALCQLAQAVDVRVYMLSYSDVWVALTRLYQKKESMRKAYFAYLVSGYIAYRESKQTRLLREMLDYVQDSSPYCRENALKVFYRAGEVPYVVDAYRKMNRGGIVHNQKLVMEGLLSFAGERTQLFDRLVQELEQFDTVYQIDFIDTIRMGGGRYHAKFFGILCDRDTDNEVRYAMLRYFRKYAYEPVRDYLFQQLSNPELPWEYCAVAALTLESYPSPETIRQLKELLHSSNWYVRYNAMDSLIALGVADEDLQDIRTGMDRYARDMVEYKMQQSQLAAVS